MDISIAMHDTKAALVNTINESRMPMCVIKEILQNIYREVSDKADIEYERALADTKDKQEIKDI